MVCCPGDKSTIEFGHTARWATAHQRPRPVEPPKPVDVPEDAILVPYDPKTHPGLAPPISPDDRMLVPYRKFVEWWNLAYPAERIGLSGGFLDSDCFVSVDVTSSTVGTHVNTTSALAASIGNFLPATDTLTVVEPPPRSANPSRPT